LNNKVKNVWPNYDLNILKCANALLETETSVFVFIHIIDQFVFIVLSFFSPFASVTNPVHCLKRYIIRKVCEDISKRWKDIDRMWMVRYTIGGWAM